MKRLPPFKKLDLNYFLQINCPLSHDSSTKSLSSTRPKFSSLASITTNSTLLSYKPKRKAKLIPVSPIPITSLGKAKINIPSIFSKGIDEYSKKKNKFKFRNEYILKYAQITENFLKTEKYCDYISESKKGQFTDYFNKIHNCIQKQNQILLAEQNPNTDETLQQITFVCVEYNNYMNKYCELIFNELQIEKEKNRKFQKKNFEIEEKLELKLRELKTLTDYVKRYDISTNIQINKNKLHNIEKIKNDFNQKENECIFAIRQLEEEIRDLTMLLNVNKEYYDKFKSSEENVKSTKKQMDEIRIRLNLELEEKAKESALAHDKKCELEEEIAKLNKEIEEKKNEIDEKKKEIVDLNALIKNGIFIIEQRENMINMLHEEKEMFVYLFDKEKIEHANTNKALKAMEQNIKIKQEQRKKEEDEKKGKEKEEEENKYNEQNKDAIKDKKKEDE